MKTVEELKEELFLENKMFNECALRIQKINHNIQQAERKIAKDNLEIELAKLEVGKYYLITEQNNRWRSNPRLCIIRLVSIEEKKVTGDIFDISHKRYPVSQTEMNFNHFYYTYNVKSINKKDFVEIETSYQSFLNSYNKIIF